MSAAHHPTGHQYKARIITKKVNVAIREEVEQWVLEAVQEFGHLSGAANVAGIAGGTGETTIETIVHGFPRFANCI
jgi:NAD(P)-dependent dehydrogenase (short-subunit alcohol dehydrogenase family)